MLFSVSTRRTSRAITGYFPSGPSEVVGCGGGVSKKNIIIYSVPAAGSRTGIIYCREITSGIAGHFLRFPIHLWISVIPPLTSVITRLQCEECCSRNQIPGLLVSKWNKDYSHLFDEFHAIGESSQVDNLPSASAVPFSLHFPFSLNPSNA